MKTKTKTIIEVEYSELDKEIAKFLKRKNLLVDKNGFNCVVEEEWSNDSEHSFAVEKEQPEDYNMKEIKEGNYHFKVGTILNWMCADGIISSGEYLVTVCW
jgi:hypothetical protein